MSETQKMLDLFVERMIELSKTNHKEFLEAMAILRKSIGEEGVAFAIQERLDKMFGQTRGDA